MNTCRKPLFFGRLFRILAGLACLIGIAFLPLFENAWLAVLGLTLAGLTFLVAGIRANPGCEITALPNLFLPSHRQLSCWCPLFSPLDRLERALRR